MAWLRARRHVVITGLKVRRNIEDKLVPVWEPVQIPWWDASVYIEDEGKHALVNITFHSGRYTLQDTDTPIKTYEGLHLVRGVKLERVDQIKLNLRSTRHGSRKSKRR